MRTLGWQKTKEMDDLFKLLGGDYIWAERRSAWWHRCTSSNKIIWPGEKAVIGAKTITLIENSEVIVLRFMWMKPKEYIILKLRSRLHEL